MLSEPEEKILDKNQLLHLGRLFDQTLNNLKFDVKLKGKNIYLLKLRS